MIMEQMPETVKPTPNGASKTVQLSSNSTLYWRVFVPIAGTTFLGLIVLSFFLIPENVLYFPFPIWWARIGGLVGLGGWLLLLRRTIWRLKRVDANDTHIFVTNYWLTVRYPNSDINRIETVQRLGRTVVNIHLHAPGRFGQKISFLPGSEFEEWRENASETRQKGI
jgi:hypothetical protein